MNVRRLLIPLLALLLLGAAPAPRSLSLTGTLTNTTTDHAGPATLQLTISGETATGTLQADAPLGHGGQLEGKFRQGWLELTGKLDSGITLQLRGALNATDYRGTYIVATPGNPVHYGRFRLVVQR